MPEKSKPEKEDLFDDERITVSIIAQFDSPLGRTHIEREVSAATARKVLKLISNPRKNP